MNRRNVLVAEATRLPAISGLTDWTAAAWEVQPDGDLANGYFDDFTAILTGTGINDGLTAKVYITSYDLDGRNDEQLADWIGRLVSGTTATAMATAAAAQPTTPAS